MLNVNHLSAEYQGRPALRDVSFQIAAGQLVVVLGPSGCGKTTLLNLIAGFIEPSAGSITLDGTPVHGPSAERGVVFQHEGLLPWRNVVDNVEFGLQLAGVGKAQRRRWRSRCCSAWGWRAMNSTLSGSFPAACANASASPALWPPIRGCCCWTSRSAPRRVHPRADAGAVADHLA